MEHLETILKQLGPQEVNLQNITDLLWRVMKLVEIVKPPLSGPEKKQLVEDILLQLTDRFVSDHAMQALLRTYITQTLPKQIDILVAVANADDGLVVATLNNATTKCCGGACILL